MKNLLLTGRARVSVFLLLIGVMITTISCRQNTRDQDSTQQQQAEIESREAERDVEPRAFTGDIRSVGNEGDNISGEIAMRIEGDLMRFTVSAEGLAPDMMHMQYLLVSQSGEETQCPGSVEEIERLGESSGTTTTSETTKRRIPLHMGATTLNMESDSYPRTNVNGDLQFSHVISLAELRTAVRDQYQMQDLDFSRFTFVIRGIPESQTSATAGSGTMKAGEIPVGCAKLEETSL